MAVASIDPPRVACAQQPATYIGQTDHLHQPTAQREYLFSLIVLHTDFKTQSAAFQPLSSTKAPSYMKHTVATVLATTKDVCATNLHT